MDLALVLRQRLEQLDLGQRHLAGAAQVTESYISQLLSGRKAPPAPARTDIYDKLEPLLKFPPGELARMAALQRQEEIKRKLGVLTRTVVQRGSRTCPFQMPTAQEEAGANDF